MRVNLEKALDLSCDIKKAAQDIIDLLSNPPDKKLTILGRIKLAQICASNIELMSKELVEELYSDDE